MRYADSRPDTTRLLVQLSLHCSMSFISISLFYPITKYCKAPFSRNVQYAHSVLQYLLQKQPASERYPCRVEWSQVKSFQVSSTSERFPCILPQTKVVDFAKIKRLKPQDRFRKITQSEHDPSALSQHWQLINVVLGRQVPSFSWVWHANQYAAIRSCLILLIFRGWCRPSGWNYFPYIVTSCHSYLSSESYARLLLYPHLTIRFDLSGIERDGMYKGTSDLWLEHILVYYNWSRASGPHHVTSFISVLLCTTLTLPAP
jgi:hypothetical protein